ncbi:hypothetical protein [Oceanobacillus sp. FSL H7-0719]|uniref:hypothetical protein n=1 Tax=Oceanobacillus sp. FSL H7-0719 TaxID=2954507 RepID=UPI00324C4AB0
MSYWHPNVDPLLLRQRTGEEDDPYIYLEQTSNVFNGSIALKEIPSFSHDVEVLNSSDVALAKSDNPHEIGIDEYIVDYTDGVVYFNTEQEGNEFTIKYWGTGYLSLPSTRIFVPNGGDDPLQSLQNILDNVDEGTTVIEQVRNIEFKGEYDPSVQYKKWNFVTFTNKTFIATKTIQGLSPSESSDWKLVSSGVGFVGVYDSGKTYNIGDMVADSEGKNIYFSKIMDNTYPLTDEGSWELMISLDDVLVSINESLDELVEFQQLMEDSDVEREMRERGREDAFEDLLDNYQSFHMLVQGDEEARALSEDGRTSSEADRKANEEIRQQNEAERIANESGRVSAEGARVQAFNALLASIEENVDTTVGNVSDALDELNELRNVVNGLIAEAQQKYEQIDEKAIELSSFITIGEFDIDAEYQKWNIVSLDGSSYMAKQDTVGNEVTDELFWFPLAKRGLDNMSISIDGVVPNQNGEIFVDDLDLVRGEDFEQFSTDIHAEIGDLSALTTVDSENLVEAINELKRRIDNISNVL